MLAELRELDALQLGALTLCNHWPVDRVVRVELQLIARKFVRSEPRPLPWVRALFLTSRGLRALRRAKGFRQHLPLGRSTQPDTRA